MACFVLAHDRTTASFRFPALLGEDADGRHSYKWITQFFSLRELPAHLQVPYQLVIDAYPDGAQNTALMPSAPVAPLADFAISKLPRNSKLDLAGQEAGWSEWVAMGWAGPSAALHACCSKENEWAPSTCPIRIDWDQSATCRVSEVAPNMYASSARKKLRAHVEAIVHADQSHLLLDPQHQCFYHTLPVCVGGKDIVRVYAEEAVPEMVWQPQRGHPPTTTSATTSATTRHASGDNDTRLQHHMQDDDCSIAIGPDQELAAGEEAEGYELGSIAAHMCRLRDQTNGSLEQQQRNEREGDISSNHAPAATAASTTAATKVMGSKPVQQRRRISKPVQSEVAGCGHFTAFPNGQVAVRFYDHTLLTIGSSSDSGGSGSSSSSSFGRSSTFSTFSTLGVSVSTASNVTGSGHNIGVEFAKCMLRDGKELVVSVDTPIGIEGYVAAALDFRRWAFMTVEERLAEAMSDAERQRRAQQLVQQEAAALRRLLFQIQIQEQTHAQCDHWQQQQAHAVA
jgi:hypothetical protein